MFTVKCGHDDISFEAPSESPETTPEPVVAPPELRLFNPVGASFPITEQGGAVYRFVEQ